MPLWWTAYSALIRRTQVFNRRTAWVRSAKTGDLRRDAVQKQEICVGTQSRRRIPASVRRAEEEDLRGYAERLRFRCVPAVTVRGVIVSLGASLQ